MQSSLAVARANLRYKAVMVCLIVVLPQTSLANAGTPLMWAGMLHLVFGNAIIGVIEGFLLSLVFGTPRAKAIIWLIAANYFSAWVGGVLLRDCIMDVLSLDITNAWKWFWVMVVLTYLITLLLECPFIASCLRGTGNLAGRTFRASLLIQSVSYLLLFAWYGAVSPISLFTRTYLVPPAELPLPASVTVYYIGVHGDVYEMSPESKVDTKLFGLRAQSENDRLFFKTNGVDSNQWDLVARLETREFNKPEFVTILTNLSIQVAVESLRRDETPNTWFNFGTVPALGIARNCNWEFWVGFWPAEGMRFSNKDGDRHGRIAYETPFGQWTIRNAAHLPTDKVLFQLGANQICLFDPETRRISLLGRGRGPVAAIRSRAVNSTSVR